MELETAVEFWLSLRSYAAQAFFIAFDGLRSLDTQMRAPEQTTLDI